MKYKCKRASSSNSFHKGLSYFYTAAVCYNLQILSSSDFSLTEINFWLGGVDMNLVAFNVVALLLAIKTALAVAPPAATCTPSSYPFTLNSTTPSAVYITISSYDAFTNGRNIQLRQTGGKGSPQIAVIDATSPVLWAEQRNGIIYTQNKTDENIRYDLGPVSHLKTVSTIGQSTLQELYFQNATASNKATGGFILEFPTQDAIYSLYHASPLNAADGWVICNKTDYWQLFYYTYFDNGPTFPGCDFIGLQVRSPTLADVAKPD